MTTIAVEHSRPTDEEVVEWRFEQLRRAGCDTRVAQILAEEGQVDLHQAVEALERGCEPAMALAIFL